MPLKTTEDNRNFYDYPFFSALFRGIFVNSSLVFKKQSCSLLERLLKFFVAWI